MNALTTTSLFVLAVAAASLTASCNRDNSASATTGGANNAATAPGASSNASRAVAQLSPTQGNNVRGTVTFATEGNGVRVTADITGLTPGDHGFHVHENGDCSAPDGKSAGNHFNPTNHPHAGRDAEARHIGDLGNLQADSSGRAQLNYVDTKLALSGANSILGRAVIVHAGRDDLKSQPSGNSGDRVACGTIEMAR